ncbi:hypothetical protein ACT80S_18380 [Ramlibacter sp. MAHUQ-53]|uniref:hypothetical protein n=1 Tax=unclassified Ramlibacter TaxID=2617605 RepID=UPI003645EB4A
MFEVELQRDADRVSDLCAAASRAHNALAESKARTSVAVAAIKAIRYIAPRDVCHLIEALRSQVAAALHGSEADAAIECLMDAHCIAERQAEAEAA